MKTEEIKHLIEPILTEHHLFLVELKISKDNVIEVFVDALEGVNIQTCIAVSREIESSLNRDEEDFELTVSSAGTTKVGAHCMFGGQVGIAGHLRIEDKTMLAAQSGVTNDIPEGSVFMGAPAFDVSKYRKCYVLFRKLPELYGQLRDLEKEIQTLKSKQ